MRGTEGWTRWLAGALAALAASCGAGGGAGVGGVGGSGVEAAAAGDPGGARPAPGMAWIIFGTDTVLAEVASLPEQRNRGLMNRDSVPDGTGMLFVFPTAEERLFWMKDTDLALDLAFFDEDHTVVSIKPMEPLDETLTGSDAPTALALEVGRGWFSAHGVEVGARAVVVFGPGLTVR